MTTNFAGRILGRDTHDNRPSAAALPEGALFSCSDHAKVYKVVAGGWVDWLVLGGGGASGVEFIGSTTTNVSSATVGSLLIDKPSGVGADDLLVAHIGIHDTTGDITLPSGWSYIRKGATATGFCSHLAYKLAGGSEPANYTFTFPASRICAGAITALRGVNTSDPIGGDAGATASGVSIVGPTLSPDATADLVLFFYGIRVDSRTITPPGVARYNDVKSTAGSSNGVVIGMTPFRNLTGTATWNPLQANASGSGTNSSHQAQMVGINAA